MTKIWVAVGLVNILAVNFSYAQEATEASDAVIPVAPEGAAVAATPPPPAANRSRMVEEVVITAQKREEALQDVPISVSAFSADLLDAKGISDPKDLPLATPGLTLGSQAGFTVTYLRGVGSDAFLMADPSVALYIDGIYFPFAHGLAQNFGAVERVEVLKGPQGTLFGRNAVGGAISVVTKAPSFDDTEISVQTAYAGYNGENSLETRAHVNLPLSDDLAVSVSGLYNRADSYIEGTAGPGGGSPLPQEVSRGGRVKLRWAPIEALDLTLAGFKLEQSGVSTMFALNSAPSVISQAVGIQAHHGYEGSVDAPTFFDLDNRVLYGQANIYLGGVDMRVLASDQYVITRSLYDFDGSQMPVVQFEAKKQFADVQTAEFQILSNNDSWGSDWLKWIGGFYYFKSRQGFDPVQLSVGGINLDNGQLAGLDIAAIGLTPALFANLSRLLAPLPLLQGVPNGSINAFGIIDTESSAAFAQATLSFTEWLSLTVGGRYQVEDREIYKSQSFVDGTGASLNISGKGLKDTTKSFKPKVSLELRPTDGVLAYASFQQAIKSATYNVINIYDRADYVKPEKMDAYEAGIKTQLFDRLVTFNAAAFQYDIKDLQVQFISLLQGGAVTFENAGGARVRGIDFDATVQILPDLVDALVFTAGGAYLDGKYTDYKNASGFNSLGVLTLNNDFTGNEITRTPKYSGTVGLSKTFFDVGNGDLELGADAYYNSGFYYLAQNSSFNEEQSYTVVGARVSYYYTPWKLRTTLFGKNVFDENYNYSRFTNDFGALDAKAPPATVGVRVNWDF